MFPALSSATPLLRRGPHQVQFGIGPDDAIVLTGLTSEEITALESLDGSRPLEELGALWPEENSRFVALVGHLIGRGYVVDALAPLPRRASVLVDGRGATTHLIVDLLRQAGLTVRHGPAAFDEFDLATRAGRPWLTEDPVDLVVRVTTGAISPVPIDLGGVDCLPVLLQTRSVCVGPIVTDDGPCLHCLDLTRADHDPAWGHVLAQVHRLPEPHHPSPLTALAASLTSSRVLAHVRCSQGDETCEAPEVSIEMSVDPPRLARRSWARHPKCHRHGRA